MWLKSLAKKEQILPRNMAKQAGISETTAKSWLLAGSVPRPKYWCKIALFLGMKFEEVSFLYINQLEEEDRIKECLVCSTPIILWKPHIKLCNSKACRMQYDRDRKKEFRMMHRSQNYVPDKRKFLGYVNDHRLVEKGSEVSRIQVNNAMQEYLNNGGKITRLEEGIADGADQFSLDMISEGIDLVEME